MTSPDREKRDELLSAYVDNELAPDERAQVEQRLAEDPSAQQFVAHLQQLRGELQSLPRFPLGASFTQQVLAQLADNPSIGQDDSGGNGGTIGGAAPTDRSSWRDASTDTSSSPSERDDRFRGFRRGLFWAGLIIAASVLLMLYQPPLVDMPMTGEQVAQSPSSDSPDQRENAIRSDSLESEVGEEMQQMRAESDAPARGAMSERVATELSLPMQAQSSPATRDAAPGSLADSAPRTEAGRDFEFGTAQDAPVTSADAAGPNAGIRSTDGADHMYFAPGSRANNVPNAPVRLQQEAPLAAKSLDADTSPGQRQVVVRASMSASQWTTFVQAVRARNEFNAISPQLAQQLGPAASLPDTQPLGDNGQSLSRQAEGVQVPDEPAEAEAEVAAKLVAQALRESTRSEPLGRAAGGGAEELRQPLPTGTWITVDTNLDTLLQELRAMGAERIETMSAATRAAGPADTPTESPPAAAPPTADQPQAEPAGATDDNESSSAARTDAGILIMVDIQEPDTTD